MKERIWQVEGPACSRQRAQPTRVEETSVVLTGHVEVDQPLVPTHFVRGDALVHGGDVGLLDGQFADCLVGEESIRRS